MHAHNLLPAIAIALTAGFGVIRSHAGDLNPPPGPIGPTMKPLTDIEPRIAINATNTPGDSDSLFRITGPGSYYLTGNITGVSGKIGIEIATAGVSIDLMGFTLEGGPGSLDGISATIDGAQDIAIRNGTIRSWGGDGVDVFRGRNNLLADLRVSGNGGHGIDASTGNTITACTALFNDMDGIRAMGGSTVTDCTANSNTGHGISVAFASTVTKCSANSNGGSGFSGAQSCIFAGCGAFGNSGDGFTLTSENLIEGCTAKQNGVHGINAGSNSTISRCMVFDNAGGITISSRSKVSGCTVTFNNGNGISILGADSQVIDNLCASNGRIGLGSGIYTTEHNNRIEGNNVTGNDFGIFLDGPVTGNMVVRNYARNNSEGNYVNPPGGNFIGTPITTNAAMNAAPNNLVNISF